MDALPSIILNIRIWRSLRRCEVWRGLEASLGRVVCIDSMARQNSLDIIISRCLMLQFEVCVRPVEIGVPSSRLFGDCVDKMRLESARLV